MEVLAAGITCANTSTSWACVPRINDVIVLDSRICARPRCACNLIPEISRADRAGHLPIRPPSKVPRSVVEHCVNESVRNAHGVVGVLARNRLISLALVRTIEARSNQSCRLFLLVHLPIDELVDIRVIHIEHDHLRGAASCAAALDGTCCAISDPKK